MSVMVIPNVRKHGEACLDHVSTHVLIADVIEGSLPIISRLIGRLETMKPEQTISCHVLKRKSKSVG